jgi:hypothetical protein
MAKVRPSLRSSSTYTETNFLRLHTEAAKGAEAVVTLEHFAYAPPVNGQPGWSSRIIIDGEKMSRADAVFIAKRYAAENGIPVIYEE